MNEHKRYTMAAATAAVFVATLGTASAQVKWDLPSGYAPSNFHTENLEKFVSDIDKASGGNLKITVHSNGSLIKADEIKRAIQGGQAQIGEIFISNYVNENPIYGLDAVPFIANGYDEARKLWQASKPAIESLLKKQGLKVLYSVAWQPGGIYSGKPLNSAKDLEGSKWRSYNAVSGRIAELVGAQPVTIQAAELSQALATGVVETFSTSSATGYDSKSWEQVGYFYNVNMSLPKNLVIVSQNAFDELDKPTQEAVLSAAAAAEDRGWKISEEKNRWYLEQLAQHGMKVEQGSPQLKSDLAKVGEIMLGEWLERAGSDGEAIMDAYRK